MENELYHHGILGMHWGERNGPPYPLSYQSHTAEQKRKNPKKDLMKYTDPKTVRQSKTTEKTEKSKHDRDREAALKTLSDLSVEQTKKIESQWKKETQQKVSEFLHSDGFKTGMKIAITVAAVYGATKLGKHFIRKYGVKLLREGYEDLTPVYHKLSDIPKAAKNYYGDYFSSHDPKGWKELTSGINHGVDASNLLLNPTRNQNCTFCSSAIIMRLKGYEVTAAEIMHGLPKEVITDWFEGVKVKIPKFHSSKKLYDYLKKQGEGSYGTLNVFFKNGGGHSVVYTVKNGTVQILDGQLDTCYGNNFSKLNENLFSLCNISKTEIFNLTNCNPTEYILRALS